MIISHKNRFIFFKSMKTGGTSVEVAFLSCLGDEDVVTGTPYINELSATNMEYCEKNTDIVNFITGKNETIHSHTSPTMFKNKYAPVIPDTMTYCRTTIVRNPWDAVVSYYWWSFHDPDVSSPNEKERDFRKMMAHLAPNITDSDKDSQDKFETFLMTKAFYEVPQRELIPGVSILEWFAEWQNEFLEDIDFFIRYEHMQKDLLYISKILELGDLVKSMPKLKTHVREPRLTYKSYYNDRSRALIENNFSKMIDCFNYEF